MLRRSEELRSLDELREFVRTTLCQHENLEPGAFPLTEHLLVRRDEPCGLYFCLHGPRAVKFSAIWELGRNTVLFYGSHGERFAKVQLVDAPELVLSLRAA